jgi:SnoaL-like domain
MNDERARDREVQTLVDEAAIRRVLHRYVRGIDRRDAELIRSCYHPGAIDHHGTFTGDRDAYVVWVLGVLEATTFTSHHLTNVLIEVVGEAAVVETYAVAFHGGESTDRRANFVAGFRYVDRFERRDGEWRIAERHVVQDWSEPWSPRRGHLARYGLIGRAGADDQLYVVAATVPGASGHSSVNGER